MSRKEERHSDIMVRGIEGRDSDVCAVKPFTLFCFEV